MVYNAFSPSPAQDAGLLSVIKINGIAHALPSYSSVDLRLIGQAGTTIMNGNTSDENNQPWNLPETVARDDETPTAADIVLAFNEAADCSIDDIQIVIVP